MSDTLESLEIRVEHTSTGAAKEIGSVTAAITKLFGAISRALPKLEAFASAMSNISSKVTINDIHDSTFNKTVQSAAKAANSDKDGNSFATPLNDDLTQQIAQANKLEIEIHKLAKAESEFETARRSGDVEKAWRAREQAVNAYTRAVKEAAKMMPKEEQQKAESQKALAPAVVPLSKELQDAISSASQIDLLKMKLDELRVSLQEAMDAGNKSKALSIQGQILQTQAALEKATAAAYAVRPAVKSAERGVLSFSQALQKAFPHLYGFISSLKRIAMYRILRTIIRGFTQSLKEGLEWAYNYSKGLADAENSSGRFAAALDRLKTASSTMKAQLGSAFIAMLAALEPILIRIINLITAAADAISQFFSAFTGTTYTKAVGGMVKAFEKGAGAAKEWKNQLLGFDEINRLNEPSGGGGGGGSPLSGIEGEDTPLSAWAMKLREDIKWCQEHMELIKDLAKAIGLALLAWKFGKFLTSLTGASVGLTQILGVAMAVAGAFLLIDGYVDAWTNGIDWENLTEIFLGLGLAVAGITLAFGATAGAITALVGGIALLALGIKEWIDTGEMSEQTCLMLQGGIAAIGIALSVLTGSWIPLAVAAVVALALAIYQHWDDIKTWLSTTWETIKNKATEIWGAIKDWFTETWELTKQQAVDTWNEIVGYLQEKWDNITSKAEEVYNAIKDFFIGGFESARDSIGQVLADLSAWFSDTFGGLIGWCQSACEWIQSVLTGLGLVGGTSSPESWNANLPEEFRAGGGFVDEGQLFVAREAGPELVGTMNGRTAVANNDQIVEGIRQGVFEAVSAAMNGGNQDVNVKVYLDSREIKHGQERLARAWG